MSTYLPKTRTSTFSLLMSVCLVFVLALTVSTLVAQEDSNEQVKDLSPAAEITSIKTSLREEISDLTDQYRKSNGQAKKEIVATRRAMEKEHVERVIEITRSRDNANRNIRDLVWFIKLTKGSARSSAYNELVKKHIDSSDLTDLAQALGQVSTPSEEIEGWIRELSENSSNIKVKGTATFMLSTYLANIQSRLNLTSKSTSEYLQKRSMEELDEEINLLLNQCLEKYAGVKIRRRTIGNIVREKLARMNLKVGRIAPDIVGVDLDDVEFKLSEYRGKVVVIDFWGDW